MSSSPQKAKYEVIVLSVALATALLVGYATTSKDYTALTDEQLIEDHDKMAQRIAAAEVQLRYLQAQAAYAITPEESAASNLCAAIVPAQLSSHQTNQASVLNEVQRRVAQRQVSIPTPQPLQPPQPEARSEAPPPPHPKSDAPSESHGETAKPPCGAPGSLDTGLR